MKNTLTIVCLFVVFLFSSAVIAQPVKPVPALPMNGEVKVSLTATLVWNVSALPDSFRIQIAKDTLFTNLAVDTTKGPAQTFTVPAGKLKNFTTYYWRISGIDMMGQGPWSDSSWFRTIDSTAKGPSLIRPTNGAKNLPFFPEFEWSAVPNAVAYQVQVATNNGFSPTVMDTVVSGLSVTLLNDTLSPDSVYYWRVRAQNEIGFGDWSLTRNFQVIFLPPSIPTLVSPANGSTNQVLTPRLDWSDAFNVTKYRVRIATDAAFTNIIYYDSVASSQSYLDVRRDPLLLAPSTTYYWSVSAGNDDNYYSKYSATYSFTTIGIRPPSRPVLLTPKTASVSASRTPTFTWADTSTSMADRYYFHISTFYTFTDTALLATTTAKNYTVPGSQPLDYISIYYWRVTGENDGGLSPSSYSWNFTTLLSAREVEKKVFAANLYPNPALTATAVEFELQQAQQVHIAVVDITGKEVVPVFDGPLSADKHNIAIDVTTLKPGTYYTVIAGQDGIQALALLKL